MLITTVCKPGDLAIVNRNLQPHEEFARGWIIRVTNIGKESSISKVWWDYEGQKFFPNGSEIIFFADKVLTPIKGLDELECEDEMLVIVKNKVKDSIDQIVETYA